MNRLAVLASITWIIAAVWTPTDLSAQPAHGQGQYQTRVAKAKQDLQAIKAALLMFRFDCGMYPTEQMGLRALVVDPFDPRLHWRAGGYLKHLLKDPWGHDYRYRIPGTQGRDYDVYSLGEGDSTATSIEIP